MAAGRDVGRPHAQDGLPVQAVEERVPLEEEGSGKGRGTGNGRVIRQGAPSQRCLPGTAWGLLTSMWRAAYVPASPAGSVIH